MYKDINENYSFSPDKDYRFIEVWKPINKAWLKILKAKIEALPSYYEFKHVNGTMDKVYVS